MKSKTTQAIGLYKKRLHFLFLLFFVILCPIICRHFPLCANDTLNTIAEFLVLYFSTYLVSKEDIWGENIRFHDLLIQITIGVSASLIFTAFIVLFASVFYTVNLNPSFQLPMDYNLVGIVLDLVLTATWEEMFFRGYLNNALRCFNVPDIAIIVIVSLFFGWMHFYENGIWVQFILAVFVSIYIFLLIKKIKPFTLFSAIVVHFVCNLLPYFITVVVIV